MTNKPLKLILSLALSAPMLGFSEELNYMDQVLEKWEQPGAVLIPIQATPQRMSVRPPACSQQVRERSSFADFDVPQIYPESVYDDLFDRCAGLIADLEDARHQAQLIGNRNLKAASKVMFDALKYANSDILRGRVYAAPHVSLAIVEGFQIANIYQAHLPDTVPVGSFRVDQAYIKFLSDVYDMIIYAYDELDQNNFSRFKEVCLRGRFCYNEIDNPHDHFSEKYFDQTRQLAVKVLDLYINNAEETGKDKVELPLAAAVADSTMKILNESVYRRDFSCDVVKLWNVKVTAQRNTCGNRYGTPLHDVVSDVRFSIAQVYNDLSLKQRGHSRCHNRRHR